MEYRQDEGFKPLGATKRRAVVLSAQSLVKACFLNPRSSLPLVMEPEIENFDPAEWIQSERVEIESSLLKYGGILFRNFNLRSVARFDRFVRAVSSDLIDYSERSSPRSEVRKGIYTSTDYPADQYIHFHNEQSYTRRWPMKLWFFCETPATQGGATPIADGRRVLALLSPKTKEAFIQKKVMYVRNYGDGFGLTWQTAFQTDNKADVESYCRRAAIEVDWRGKDRLRTRQVFDAIVRHPRSGEMVWFEHAAFFHVSSLPAQIREGILRDFREEDLPSNTYYGDGSPIETSVIEEIRETYRNVATSFSWQKGDLLLIDNMLVSHSREPFKGERRILVAMSDLYSG